MEVENLRVTSKLCETSFLFLVSDIESDVLKYCKEGKENVVLTLLRRIYCIAEERAEGSLDIATENKRLQQSHKLMRDELERERRKVNHYDSLMDFMRARLLRRDTRSAVERKAFMKEVVGLRDQLFRVTELHQTVQGDGVAFPMSLEDQSNAQCEDPSIREREEEAEALEQLKEDHTAQLRMLQLQLSEETGYRERLLKEAEVKLHEEVDRNKKTVKALESLRTAAVSEVEQTWVDKTQQLHQHVEALMEEVKLEAQKCEILQDKLQDREHQNKMKCDEISELLKQRNLLKNLIHKLQGAIDQVKRTEAGKWTEIFEEKLLETTDRNTYQELMSHQDDETERQMEMDKAQKDLKDVSKKLVLNQNMLRAMTNEMVQWKRKSTVLQDKLVEEERSNQQSIHRLQGEIRRISTASPTLLPTASAVTFAQTPFPTPQTFRCNQVETLRSICDVATECVRKDNNYFKGAVVRSTFLLCFAWSFEIARRVSGDVVDSDFLMSQDWTRPSGRSRGSYANWLRVLIRRKQRDLAVRDREQHVLHELKLINTKLGNVLPGSGPGQVRKRSLRSSSVRPGRTAGSISYTPTKKSSLKSYPRKQ